MDSTTIERVRIVYHRPPHRRDIFEQTVVHRDPSCIVTFVERTPIEAPLLVDGVPVLEPDSPALWFTFPAAWYDVGRFHVADGAFTGFYANVLTPVRLLGRSLWETTDLFLDVWLARDGSASILDAEELMHAERERWISARLAAAARAEAGRLMASIRANRWPPAIVHEWTLDRARAAAAPRHGTPPPPAV